MKRLAIKIVMFAVIIVLTAAVMVYIIQRLESRKQAALPTETQSSENSASTNSVANPVREETETILTSSNTEAGKVIRFSDIPVGRFRSQFEALPEELQQRVLQKAAALDIPFADYDSLRVHPSGAIYYVCTFGDGGRPVKDGTLAAARLVAGAGAFPAAVPSSSPLIRHSRSGAGKVLFLDFNGHMVTNTVWNSDPDYGSVASWDCRPYDFDGNDATFSDSEQAAMVSIWERVAEDYAPFDVDVTTEEPTNWNSSIAHALITPGKDKNGVSCPHDGYGGIAYVDVFGDAGFSYDYSGECYSPAWVLNYELPGYAEYEAEAAAHELGHNLGLSHDGQIPRTAYYDGHENGSISWGPIMGTGYDRNVTQWSKGEYRKSNNTEDDLNIIQLKLAYRPDDYGDNNVGAAALNVDPSGDVLQSGVVETTDDPDVLHFTTEAGQISISIDPYRDTVGTTWGCNLDILLELYDGSNVLVAFNNPVLDTSAAITSTVAAGKYYLHIRPVGVGTPLANPPTGYTSYGSLGQYSITGTVIGPDLDEDGLPNTWEQLYFGDPTNAVAAFDTDGDGFDNLYEYISGFDPTNANSFFEITSSDVSGIDPNGFVLYWNSVSGRVYDINWRTDLTAGAFDNIHSNIFYPQNSYTDTVHNVEEAGFYQIKVQLQE